MSSVFTGARNTWPTALGAVPYGELPQALTDISRLHARRAVAGIGATDPLDLIDQAVSAGAALELLLKAALASVDIHLIRDGRSNHIAALSMSGLHRTPALPPLPDIRTVGPGEATDLLALLTEQSFTPRSDLKLVTTVRDSAVHMGFVDAKANERAVSRLVKVIAWVLDARRTLSQDGDWDAYWADNAAQARAILDARNEEIFTEYERRISAARARFTTLTRTEAGRDAVAYLEEGEDPLAVNEISRDATCPACSSRGRTVYDVVCRPLAFGRESDSMPDSGYSIIGRPRQFHCGVCKLALIGDDLEAAQIVDEVQLRTEETSRDGFFDWLVMTGIEDQE